jgi:cysteinyl-tRNA synthetase
MVSQYFHETLSIYCGGIDNLYRHHDYTKAILESIRPYPMAKFWLHCNHLYVNGQKMSKSKGNVIYTDTLLKQGYSMAEIRFFLIYGHYREKLNYSDRLMSLTATKLRTFRTIVKAITKKTGQNPSPAGPIENNLRKTFTGHMDNDLHFRNAFDGICEILSGINVDELNSAEAARIIKTLKNLDDVLKVIF